MVKEQEGNLILTRVVTNDSNKPVTSMIFNNYYNPDGGAANIPGGKVDVEKGPKTGDESNANFYWGLLFSGGIVSLGTTIYLIAGGKSERRS
jgi:hypothetical protein